MPRHKQLLSRHLGTFPSPSDAADKEWTSSEDEAPKVKNGRLPMKFAMSSSSEEDEEEDKSSDEGADDAVNATETLSVEPRGSSSKEAGIPEASDDEDEEIISPTEPSRSSASAAAGAVSKKKKPNKRGKRKGGGGSGGNGNGGAAGSKSGDHNGGGASSSGVAGTDQPSSGIVTKALVGRDVEVVGTSRVDLNGKRGRCIDFDVSRGRYLVQLPSSAASATNTAASNTATTAPPPPPPLALKPENLVLCTDGGSEGGGSNYRSALAISEARLYGDQHEVVRLRFRRSPFGACDHMVRCSRGRPLKDVKVLLAKQVYSDTGVDEAALAPADTEVLFKGQVLEDDAATLATYGVEHNAKLGFRRKTAKVSLDASSGAATAKNAAAGTSSAAAAAAATNSTSSPPSPVAEGQQQQLKQQEKEEARHLPYGGDVSAAMKANDRAAIRAIFEWRQRKEEGGAPSHSGSGRGGGSSSGSGIGGNGSSKGAAAQGRLSGIKVIGTATTSSPLNALGAPAAAGKATATRSAAQELAAAAACVEELEREAAEVVEAASKTAAERGVEVLGPGEGFSGADGDGSGDGNSGSGMRKDPASTKMANPRQARLAMEEKVTAAMIALDCLDLSSAAAAADSSGNSDRESGADGSSEVRSGYGSSGSSGSSNRSSSSSGGGGGGGNGAAAEGRQKEDVGCDDAAESLRARRKELYRQLHLVAASLSDATCSGEDSTTATATDNDEAADATS